MAPVVPALQCRSRFCHAEKRHTGHYQQVCDHPESTGIGIMQFPTNTTRNRQLYLPVEIQKMLEGSGRIRIQEPHRHAMGKAV